MKKMKKSLVALVLSVFMLLFSVSPIVSAEFQAAYNKMAPDLLTAFSNLPSNGTLDVVVWLEDESTAEFQSAITNLSEPQFDSVSEELTEYNLQAISDIGYDEEHLSQIAAMNEYIMQKRLIAQAIYLEDNTAIAAEIENAIDGDVVYISKYSPVVICNVSQTDAISLAMNNNVVSLDNGSLEVENCMNISVPAVGGSQMEQLGYLASGIKIGMIESAVPNVYSTYLSDSEEKMVLLNDTNSDEAKDASNINHATAVASVMIGNPLGIARDVSGFYAAATDNMSEMIENVEWLLDQGVNVINFSWGTIKCTQRNVYSEWLDHVAYNHSVHCVAATGNDGADRLSNLALCYNVISVGNVDDKGTITRSDDVHYTSLEYLGTDYYSPSSYVNTLNNVPNKPDISAPGKSISIGGGTGGWIGTSFSAPHVSAIVAVLCSYKPTLLTKQALMKSILLSSVSTDTQHRYSTTDVGYKQYGSGIVNAYNAKLLIDSGNYVNSSITASKEYKEYSLGYLNAGDTITVTLSFLKRSRFTGSDHSDPDNLTVSDLANLDIYICPADYADGAYFNYVGSATTNNNVEKYIFEVQSSEEYVVVIDKVTGQGSYEVLFGLSWLVDSSALQ